jgi:broad specificity phosphatase PhoE
MAATEVWLTRHGESAGNVAAARAEASGDVRLGIELRDADVPLTATGVEQAEALGTWLAEQPEPPATVWSSPFLRAAETARLALASGGLETVPRTDERLRDRDLGILDLVSTHGIEQLHPEEWARRLRLGKFWYRPPGGESWADVALRLRSIAPEIVASEGPVLVVAHDVVVSLFVYVLCGMTEHELMDLVAGRPVGNATVTRLTFDGRAWRLDDFAAAGHLAAEDAPVTEHAEEEGHADVV